MVEYVVWFFVVLVGVPVMSFLAAKYGTMGVLQGKKHFEEFHQSKGKRHV